MSNESVATMRKTRKTRPWRPIAAAAAVAVGAVFGVSSKALAQANINVSNGSTTFQTLGFLSLSSTIIESRALGVYTDPITHAASVVGYSYTTAGQEAFIWHTGDTALTPLGSLGPPFTGSAANAISATGWGVGSSTTNTSGESTAVRMNGSTIEALPTLAAGTQHNIAFAISADGKYIAGSALNASGQRAPVLWRGDGTSLPTPVELPNYTGTTTYNIVARGVTNDGLAAVGQGRNNTELLATYWTFTNNTASPSAAQQLAFVDPSVTGLHTSVARSVMATGSNLSNGTFVAVGSGNALNPFAGTSTEAAAWKVDSANPAGTVTKLGFTPSELTTTSYSSNANAISAQNDADNVQAVVGSFTGQDSLTDVDANSHQQAFLYLNVSGANSNTQINKMFSLKRLLNNNATNNYYADAAKYNLNIPTSFRLIEAMAVSADGQTIVGYGVDSNSGRIEAWALTLAVPEPTSTTIAISFCGTAMLKRRRRR
jgi:hypothetical protein